MNSSTTDEIESQGGEILDIKEVDGDTIKGSYESVGAAPGNRIASVDFDGIVSNGILSFSFEDDGWGDAGSGILTFRKDNITVKLDTELSEDNSMGWTLGNGLYTFSRAVPQD
jgi:hypothetical protein